MILQDTLKIALTLLTVITMSTPAMAAKSAKVLSESIQIEASPEAVFNAIRNYRNSSNLHRRLVSYDGEKAVVDEQLVGVPVYGTVHCTWEEKEVPFQRIDYAMLNSDKFVSGSGSYVIGSSAQPGYVTLELNSTLDSGCHVPFAKEIGNMAAHKDMKQRLLQLKRASEETRIAQKQ